MDSAHAPIARAITTQFAEKAYQKYGETGESESRAEGISKVNSSCKTTTETLAFFTKTRGEATEEKKQGHPKKLKSAPFESGLSFCKAVRRNTASPIVATPVSHYAPWFHAVCYLIARQGLPLEEIDRHADTVPLIGITHRMRIAET